MANNFEKVVDMIMPVATQWRQYLHIHPNRSSQNDDMIKFIVEKLEEMKNIEINQITQTSVIGIVRGDAPGKKIALRSDIDSLPISNQEDSNVESSAIGGIDASGQDYQTAMLLATAGILSANKQLINGEVHFIFQNSSDSSFGGAKEIVEAGVLNEIDYIFSNHVWSGLPVGTVGVKYGTFFASNDEFNISIHGKGGLSAFPNTTIDPVIIGAEIIMALQTIVSRKSNSIQPPVITVAKVNAGTENRYISDVLTMSGTVTCLDKEVHQEVESKIKSVCDGIANTHGATCEFEYIYGSPLCDNDIEATKIVKNAAKTFVKEDCLIFMDNPVACNEDFAYYLEKTKGCFSIIGIGSKEVVEEPISENNEFSEHKYTLDETAVTTKDDAMRYGIMLYLNTIMGINYPKA